MLKQISERYFPETGVTLIEPFLNYWLRFGGDEVFGLPLTPIQFEDILEAEMKFTTKVQYFENVVMEIGYYREVRLRALGTEAWRRKFHQFDRVAREHERFRSNFVPTP